MFLEPIFIQQHRARVKQVTVGYGTHQGQETYRLALAILRLIKVRLEISVPNFYQTKAGSLACKPRARKAEELSVHLGRRKSADRSEVGVLKLGSCWQTAAGVSDGQCCRCCSLLAPLRMRSAWCQMLSPAGACSAHSGQLIPLE